MGLIIDYLEQEKDRLKTIIAESQQIKQCVTQFIKGANQYKDSFIERIASIKSAIRECEKSSQIRKTFHI